MSTRRAIAVMIAGLCSANVDALRAAGKDKQTGNQGRAPAVPQGKPAQNNAGRNLSRPNAPDAHPGERALERLENMTPEQRRKAMASLPPERRQEIEKKLEQFDRLPPAERIRMRNQLERMNNLPPQRQNQIRRSIQQFQNLPDDRKPLVRRELDRIAAMPDDARESYMNTEEFRNRFTPNEQQMMENLSKILPENPDNKD